MCRTPCGKERGSADSHMMKGERSEQDKVRLQ